MVLLQVSEKEPGHAMAPHRTPWHHEPLNDGSPHVLVRARQDVRIEALDGCTLAAWHIPAQDDAV